jgi:hypothetical protein
VVELASSNLLRNSCQGGHVIELGDGTVLDTCIHWELERGLSCVLPRLALPVGSSGKWVQMSSSGPVIRG